MKKQKSGSRRSKQKKKLMADVSIFRENNSNEVICACYNLRHHLLPRVTLDIGSS